MTVLGASGRAIGFGCMRLAGSEVGVGVIRAAIAAGARLLDTSPVYWPPGGGAGDNERMVSRALAAEREWTGVVATKGGMTRRGTRWIPDGRKKSLWSSCEESARALDVRSLDLYMLHAPDPRVDLLTSVRALAELRAAGAAAAIGLCNVNRSQLDAALAVTELDALSVAISPVDISAVRGGLVDRAKERGIAVIAHGPLGGPKAASKLAKHPILAEQAEALGISVHQLVLAWLADLEGPITAIPGATRIESARAAVAAQSIELDPRTRAVLDAALEAGPLLSTAASERRPAPSSARAEVVILMGSPGAGKSTAAAAFGEKGYVRLNRDKRGGTLASLIAPLEKALGGEAPGVVLDNTYASRSSRNQVIEAAWRHGATARCVFLDTAIEEAQVNAVTRMLRASGGELPTPERIKAASRKSAGFYPPGVLFRYERELEVPDLDEGFESVERRPFVRRPRARASARALIFELDGVLRRTVSGAPRPLSPADVEVVPGRREQLTRFRDAGWLLLATSWQPELESGELLAEDAAACLQRTVGLLGVEIEVAACPHGAGPPRCWCRKPLPGLGVYFVERHGLDVGASIVVGRSATDALFASRLGFAYRDAESFSLAEI